MNKEQLKQLLYVITFMVIYSVLDYLNMPYKKMIETFGLYLVIINILLNLIMSILSSYMIRLSEALYKNFGVRKRVDNASFLSVIIGIFTYGCTPCVISFLSAIGITFSVIALPLAGLPYKLISLLILMLASIIITKSSRRITCKNRRI